MLTTDNGLVKVKSKTKFAVLCILLLAAIFAILPGCGDTGPRGETRGTGVRDGKPDPDWASDSSGSGNSQEEPDGSLVLCPLSGEMVPEGTTDRRPLAVMIENAPAARPQSGLDRADVVYEILAEGAITRFLAIYLHGDTSEVGPVRSARPYYIERMLEYDAMYAYCGGSEAAKEMVRSERVAALDEFGIGRQAYWRTKDRKAPHNLYGDTNKLRQVGAKKGYEKIVRLPVFDFLAGDGENPGGITTDRLVINYPRSFSVVRWEYNSDRRLYLREQGGEAHLDAVTGKQLTGANIIVQFVNTKVIDSEGRREMSMTGRGRAWLFTGGRVYSGTWAKKGIRSQTFFYGENGEVLQLNPGQTWIEVVPAGTKIEYGT